MNALRIPDDIPFDLGTPEDPEAFIKRADAATKAPWKSQFGAMFLDDLDTPGEEVDSLIEGWLSLGDKSVIGGPSKSGKSFLAIHAGMCVATAQKFFGMDVKPGLVIYQAGEGARGVKKRLRAWRHHHGVEFGRKTPFVLLRSAIDLYRPDGDTPKLIAEIMAISDMFSVPLRLVVIDTLATATAGADENSGKDMSVVMANVAKINTATKAHVCLVHHMNAGGTKLRGHTSIYANIDQVVLVTSNEVTKVRTAVLDKQKDDADGLRLQFELKRIEYGEGKNDASCVCLPKGQKDAIRQEEEAKGFTLSVDEVIFMKALFEADKVHGRPVPNEMTNIPATIRSIVGVDNVKRVWAPMQSNDAMPDDSATPEDVDAAKKRHRETLKKRWQRMREKLTRWNVAGFGEEPGTKREIMWFTGKPLRAFPQTLPRDEPEYGAGAPAENSNHIPF